MIGLARSCEDEEADAEDEDLETKSGRSCCSGTLGCSFSLGQLVEFGVVALASWPSIDDGSGNTDNDGDKSNGLGDGGLYWAMD